MPRKIGSGSGLSSVQDLSISLVPRRLFFFFLCEGGKKREKKRSGQETTCAKESACIITLRLALATTIMNSLVLRNQITAVMIWQSYFSTGDLFRLFKRYFCTPGVERRVLIINRPSFTPLFVHPSVFGHPLRYHY